MFIFARYSKYSRFMLLADVATDQQWYELHAAPDPPVFWWRLWLAHLPLPGITLQHRLHTVCQRYALYRVPSSLLCMAQKCNVNYLLYEYLSLFLHTIPTRGERECNFYFNSPHSHLAIPISIPILLNLYSHSRLNTDSHSHSHSLLFHSPKQTKFASKFKIMM